MSASAQGVTHLSCVQTPQAAIYALPTATSRITLESFQVDPALLTGILQTSLLSDWAPYAVYVSEITADSKYYLSLQTIIINCL